MFKIETDKITLPHPDRAHVMPEQWSIYTRFIGHMRHVPVSRMEIKILSAIQFTADMIDISDAHTAKELVDMGLRAPRIAFPIEFLDYMDSALLRCGFDIGAPSKEMIELRDQWFTYKEQPNFTSFRHVHHIIKEDILSS
ncbi:MAG: hypothetical protein COA45_00875 [Zetaproteobacteria bacterium]|nr:MAG: hypothetical protein COA45_00875 [Zetaproteobacteria bacterium]